MPYLPSKEGLNQNEGKTNENKGHSRHTDVAVVKLYYLLGWTILLCNNSVIFVKLYNWEWQFLIFLIIHAWLKLSISRENVTESECIRYGTVHFLKTSVGKNQKKEDTGFF